MRTWALMVDIDATVDLPEGQTPKWLTRDEFIEGLADGSVKIIGFDLRDYDAHPILGVKGDSDA